MKELIRQGIQSIDNPLIKATEEELDRLAEFAQNLLEHGSERGLTALTNPEDIVRELIVDSLGAMPYRARSAYCRYRIWRWCTWHTFGYSAS